MRVLRLAAAIAAVVGLLALPAAVSAAKAQTVGEGSPNLTLVKNLSYETAEGSDVTNGGTDIEFTKIKGRRYALAGSYKNGLQIVDITDPESAEIVGVYDCIVQQGDVQVFERKRVKRNKRGKVVRRVKRTFVSYTMDTGYTPGTTSGCYTEAAALGFSAAEEKFGTFIADISDPTNPKTVSWVPFAQGSHNHTVDPSGKYIYNSNSDLITSTSPAIEISDISNLRKPRAVGELPLPFIPGLGSESHDITFNEDGTRAYSAALSHTNIIDTTDKENPEIISTIVDPMINVHHQADPVTLTDVDGVDHTYLIIEDEFAGATGTGQCPNGGVHVWDVTDEALPIKVGYWNIADVGPTADGPMGRCTAHVFDIHKQGPSNAVMTIAYYNGGVRVVDISNLTGVSLGTQGIGMKELAWYRIPDGDTWSAKTPAIEADGSFWLYGNDIARGLDIYRYAASAEASATPGKWLSAAEASLVLPKASLPANYKPFCLLGDSGLVGGIL